MYRPLADEIRPLTLDEVYGQRHILGENGLLRRIIASGNVPNMIFYGPSGSGKTTVANIIARETNRELRKLNATTASLSDIKDIIAELDSFLVPNGVLLYLDEIQYFNKKQQQSLLEFIENGKITLIASTTENPYFYVYNAILSRSTVFEFKELPPDEVEKAVLRAVSKMEERLGTPAKLEDGVSAHIAASSGGDVRKAINAVELLFTASKIRGGYIEITLEDAVQVSQKSAMHYDRDGDQHFDAVSALMKSLRGSDPDAALHYLARTLSAGDLPGACRRIMCSASEDIGLAYPQAVPIVKACVDAALQLGLPEARLP
ncbi:MAG: AAA family ATPase, partial [Oscillospiraceae bacterium]|nr:AAA family ATPase [Oscillospiraceae bacterium]